MPIFEAIFDRVRKEAEEEKAKDGELTYWMECPGCSRRVVKKQLLRKGCYICGWHEASNEAELAKIGRDSQVRNDAEQRATPYRTNCPQCKARVIRRELVEKGCYVCGWKPDM